jgi:hypothetical protein
MNITVDIEPAFQLGGGEPSFRKCCIKPGEAFIIEAVAKARRIAGDEAVGAA